VDTYVGTQHTTGTYEGVYGLTVDHTTNYFNIADVSSYSIGGDFNYVGNLTAASPQFQNMNITDPAPLAVTPLMLEVPGDAAVVELYFEGYLPPVVFAASSGCQAVAGATTYQLIQLDDGLTENYGTITVNRGQSDWTFSNFDLLQIDGTDNKPAALNPGACAQSAEGFATTIPVTVLGLPLTYTVAISPNGYLIMDRDEGEAPTVVRSANVPLQPLDITQGTLAATNYAFNFVNGVITIVAGTTQTITFPQVPPQTYGVGPISLLGSSTSGFPVSYKVAGAATISGSTLNILGAGMVTVTASQPGQGVYSAASPVVQTITIAPAVLTAMANSVSRVDNVANPALTATLTGFVNGDTSSSVGGSPNFTTTAVPGSPVGTYPINITQGGLAGTNYTIAVVPGTLTVTSGGPSQDFSVTANPQIITVSPGQTQQTTLSLTPINYFLGSVTLSCNNLPANVTCIFSPTGFNVDGTGNIPNYVTLTINTNSSTPIVGQLKTPNSGLTATRTFVCFLFPAGVVFLFLPVGRRRLNSAVKLLLVCMLLSGMAGLGGCGGHSSGGQSGIAAPGTSTFTVMETGTSSNATTPVTHTLQLTLTVVGPQ
jgi:hypothetical protein